MRKSNPKPILILGSSKFIGRSLCEFLSQNNKYNTSFPKREELNLTDTDNVNKYFNNKHFDFIIQCAGKRGDETNILRDNLLITYNLEKNRRHFDKIIYLSSGAVYNTNKPVINVKESDVNKFPEDEYGLSKYTIENLLHKNDIVLRPFGVYGKYEDYSRRFISRSICRVICKMPIVIYKDRFMSYIYIDDFINMIEHFINNEPKEKNKIYNATPDEPELLSELANEISEWFDGDTAIVSMNSRELGFEYSGSNSKIRKELPKTFRFTKFRESIPELIKYYIKEIERENIDLSKVLN